MKKSIGMALLLALAVMPVANAQSRHKKKKHHRPPAIPVVTECLRTPYARNWEKFPAVVAVNDVTRTLYAFSDIHGEVNNVFDLLINAKIVTGSPLDFKWTAENSIMVIAGNIINRGISSMSVIDLLIRLEAEAAKASSAVYVLMGNHEAGFLAKPSSSIFRSIHSEMVAGGLDLCKDFFAPGSSYGAWLRNRPAAILINGIFINHTGYTANLSMSDIEHSYKDMVNTDSFDNEFACGAKGDGFFNKSRWWINSHNKSDDTILDSELTAVGAAQILFGHDRSAFGSSQKMVGYFGNDAGRALVKLNMAIRQPSGRGSLYKCSDWLPKGGCKNPQTFANPAIGNAPDTAKWEPLEVKGDNPSTGKNGVERGNWCVGYAPKESKAK